MNTAKHMWSNNTLLSGCAHSWTWLASTSLIPFRSCLLPTSTIGCWGIGRMEDCGYTLDGKLRAYLSVLEYKLHFVSDNSDQLKGWSTSDIVHQHEPLNIIADKSSRNAFWYTESCTLLTSAKLIKCSCSLVIWSFIPSTVNSWWESIKRPWILTACGVLMDIHSQECRIAELAPCCACLVQWQPRTHHPASPDHPKIASMCDMYQTCCHNLTYKSYYMIPEY